MKRTDESDAMPHYSDQIVQSLTSGVIAVDAEGRIIISNPAACLHLHLNPEDLKAGTPFDSLSQLKPFLGILAEMAETCEPMSRREVFVGEEAFTMKEVGVSASLLEGRERYNGAILLFVDMTERRKLERAASVNFQLASLGELAAGVVHELRNPLTIISGRAELLLRQLGDNENHRVSLESIMEETRLLGKSIGQFLEFAKPFELKPAPCMPQDIIKRVFQLCAQRAKEKSVSVTVQYPGECDQMHVDPARLAEALGNIMSNGIDAVDQGGQVELRVEQQGPMTIFTIEDDGPGIHMKEGEDILSPFVTEKRDGTGLGLSIVNRIVATQGGRIKYGNRPEGGAYFEVTIPTVQGRGV